mmetsp:Transcript_15435/g.42440  ORF Transcript_15435/g.42440 Transcript_15435/m.42440 type:complete len:267 (-) Transcript_15435:498-1298(-)
MDFFGVRSVSIASCKTSFTVRDIEVKRSVLLPTSDAFTESASFIATSCPTFFDIKDVLKLARMGCKSSSVSTAPPVRFFTPRVKLLNRPPTRPAFAFALSSLDASSSESSLDGRDATSSSFMKFPSSSPMNSSFNLAASSPLSPFLEKSSSFILAAETFPPSQNRASFPFFPSVGSFASFASFAFFWNFGGAFGFVPALAAAAGSASSPSSSSPPSSLPEPAFVPPFLPFFFEPFVMFFSSAFLITSWPLFVSANDLMARGRFDSW